MIDDAAFTTAGQSIIKDRSHRGWMAHFAAPAARCVDMWTMIDPVVNISASSLPVHLLWALMLMKVYAAEEVLANISRVTPKTYRKWAWRFINALATLSNSLILLENRFIDDIGNIIKLSVDCTDCPIWEPTPFSSAWCSFKLKRAALRYEVAINVRTGDICWIHGPFPAGANVDKTIYRRALKLLLRPGEMVHADRGYRGDETCSTAYNQSFRQERLVARVVRARHETGNKRFKDFKALSTPFRHPIDKHGQVFKAAASVIQLNIRGGSPLFHVEYQELTFLHHCLNHGSLDIVYKALKNHPWLVPDKYAEEDGVVYLHGGEARVRGRGGA